MTGFKARIGASGTVVLDALLYMFLWRQRNGIRSVAQPENHTTKPELDGAVTPSARMNCWRGRRRRASHQCPVLRKKERLRLLNCHAEKRSYIEGSKDGNEWEWSRGYKGSLIIREMADPDRETSLRRLDSAGVPSAVIRSLPILIGHLRLG